MTDLAQNRKLLAGRGASFSVALGNLLSEAIGLISSSADQAEPDHSVRFQAVAGTQTDLIAACLNAVMQEIDAFDRRPLGVILDGVRPIDNGFRAWGTLFLDYAKAAPTERVRPRAHALVRRTSSGAEVTIEVICE
jgi:hypothetical protein